MSFGVGYDFLDPHGDGMVVTDSRLFDRGHMIARWAEGIAANFQANVREMAPVNKRPNTGHGAPGALKAGLNVFTVRPQVRTILVTLTSDAPYTKWVDSGTSGPIVAHTAHGMRIPINPGFGRAPTKSEQRNDPGHTRHRAVSGQRGQHFITRAYDRTAALHPSLKGFAASAFSAAPVGAPGAPNPYYTPAASRRR